MTDAIHEHAPARLLTCSVSEKIGGLVTAAVLAATGVFFVVQSAAMDLGTSSEPGPGFIPLGLGILLALFSGAIIIDTLRPREAVAIAFGHRDVLVVYGCLVMVPVIFEPVGAYITLGLFTAAVLILVGRVRLWQAALSSAVAMVAVHGFFGQMLGLRLPAGLLEYVTW